MTKQLGKIKKPDAENYINKRKLFIVPLIFSGEEAPTEYVEKFNLYWQQVTQHVANLESRIGKVSHIYQESISLTGEKGLNVMEKLNPPCYQIIQDKCQGGAMLETTEESELVEESMDWERCLLTVGFISKKVAKTVTEFYVEVLRKRFEHISRRIDETLKANEVGLLFIREGHSVQFHQDIEVFSVVPPALDEFRRWQRDHSSTDKKTEQ